MVTEFEDIIALLTDAGIEFIVIGGLAANVHGSSRVTGDVDVVYRRTPENLERIVSALAPHHPYLRGAPPGLPFRWDVSTLQRGLNFTLITDLGDLDLLGEIPGGDFERLRPFTKTFQVLGSECQVLELPKLIEVKRAAGRPKDIEAIAEMEALLAILGKREEGP